MSLPVKLTTASLQRRELFAKALEKAGITPELVAKKVRELIDQTKVVDRMDREIVDGRKVRTIVKDEVPDVNAVRVGLELAAELLGLRKQAGPQAGPQSTAVGRARVEALAEMSAEKVSQGMAAQDAGTYFRTDAGMAELNKRIETKLRDNPEVQEDEG
jgi:hypothetical protein